MNILLFEWLNCGGLRNERFGDSSAEKSMLRQGREMLSAVIKDFQAGGHQVLLPLDGRLWDAIPNRSSLEKRKVLRSDDLNQLLHEFGGEADFILVIAPESDSILVDCLQWLSPSKHKLLNPSFEFTALTSDKNKMFDYLGEQGFTKFPRGTSHEYYLEYGGWEHWPLPLVFKPADGAGGEGIVILRNYDVGNASDADGLTAIQESSNLRVEEYVEGTPVSVSAICGPNGSELLAPTIQVFDQESEHGMHYLEAQYPIDESLSKRAINLATEVINALPPTLGYIGIDMVLGEEDGQPKDWLIEVNPRLTTSYLKLREIYDENLASLMLKAATAEHPNQPHDRRTTCSFLKPSL